jgi:hypothetical protein
MRDGHMDAKVLRRAAELVDQGHCKNVLGVDESGAAVSGGHEITRPDIARVCVAGAVVRAAHEVAGISPFACSAWWHMGAPMISRVTGAKDADEVAAALREAADRCESVSPERTL